MLIYRKILFVFFLSIFSYSFCLGQTENFDRIYGLDPTLYNGKLYTFVPPAGSAGDQFLENKIYSPGSATIKGKKYDSLLLNYDLVNQQLLLRFRHLNGTTSILCLSKSTLDNIAFNNKVFEVLKPANSEETIYQTIGKGKAKIIFSWWKVLSANNSYGESNMVFSKAHRAMFVYRNNQAFKYKNNRSFVFCFPKEQQQSIKQYLRQNNFKVSSLSDAELAVVIDFCNTI